MLKLNEAEIKKIHILIPSFPSILSNKSFRLFYIVAVLCIGIYANEEPRMFPKCSTTSTLLIASIYPAKEKLVQSPTRCAINQGHRRGMKLEFLPNCAILYSSTLKYFVQGDETWNCRSK